MKKFFSRNSSLQSASKSVQSNTLSSNVKGFNLAGDLVKQKPSKIKKTITLNPVSTCVGFHKQQVVSFNKLRMTFNDKIIFKLFNDTFSLFRFKSSLLKQISTAQRYNSRERQFYIDSIKKGRIDSKQRAKLCFRRQIFQSKLMGRSTQRLANFLYRNSAEFSANSMKNPAELQEPRWSSIALRMRNKPRFNLSFSSKFPGVNSGGFWLESGTFVFFERFPRKKFKRQSKAWVLAKRKKRRNFLFKLRSRRIRVSSLNKFFSNFKSKFKQRLFSIFNRGSSRITSKPKQSYLKTKRAYLKLQRDSFFFSLWLHRFKLLNRSFFRRDTFASRMLKTAYFWKLLFSGNYFRRQEIFNLLNYYWKAQISLQQFKQINDSTPFIDLDKIYQAKDVRRTGLQVILKTETLLSHRSRFQLSLLIPKLKEISLKRGLLYKKLAYSIQKKVSFSELRAVYHLVLSKKISKPLHTCLFLSYDLSCFSYRFTSYPSLLQQLSFKDMEFTKKLPPKFFKNDLISQSQVFLRKRTANYLSVLRKKKYTRWLRLWKTQVLLLLIACRISIFFRGLVLQGLRLDSFLGLRKQLHVRRILKKIKPAKSSSYNLKLAFNYFKLVATRSFLSKKTKKASKKIFRFRRATSNLVKHKRKRLSKYNKSTLLKKFWFSSDLVQTQNKFVYIFKKYQLLSLFPEASNVKASSFGLLLTSNLRFDAPVKRRLFYFFNIYFRFLLSGLFAKFTRVNSNLITNAFRFKLNSSKIVTGLAKFSKVKFTASTLLFKERFFVKILASSRLSFRIIWGALSDCRTQTGLVILDFNLKHLGYLFGLKAFSRFPKIYTGELFPVALSLVKFYTIEVFLVDLTLMWDFYIKRYLNNAELVYSRKQYIG